MKIEIFYLDKPDIIDPLNQTRHIAIKFLDHNNRQSGQFSELVVHVDNNSQGFLYLAQALLKSFTKDYEAKEQIRTNLEDE